MVPPVDASRPITSLTPPPHETDAPSEDAVGGERPEKTPAKSSEKLAAKSSEKTPAKSSGKVAAKSSEKLAAKSSGKLAARGSGNVSEQTSRRRRVWRKAIVTLAMAIGIGVGLWHDDVGRSDLTDELGRAASAIGAFVVESLIR